VSAMIGPVYHGLDLTLLARTMMLLITCGSKGEYEAVTASALREGGAPGTWLFPRTSQWC
jgi:hypothetical protein